MSPRSSPRLGLLSLVALRLLSEGPMHPYELSRQIHERRIDLTLGVKRGSLYHAVERLERDGLVEATETSRQGRRPERTVYRITDAGTDAFAERLRELVTDVVHEPTRFTAGVEFLRSVSPREARGMLESRRVGLTARIAALDAILRLEWPGAVRSQALEYEYGRALAAAELAWVEQIIDDLRRGRLTWGEDDAPVPLPRLELVSPGDQA